MAEIRFEDPVGPADALAFHKDRPAADHVHQSGSALRVLLAAGYATYAIQQRPDVVTVGDFGCGTAGFLMVLRSMTKTVLPDRPLRFWGYDAQPANIEVARRRGFDVKLADFTDPDEVIWPDCIILTEVLEHLREPRAFLRSIPPDTVIVATCPATEHHRHHDPTHIWSWPDEAFRELLEDCDVLVERVEWMHGVFHAAIGRKRVNRPESRE